jgi:glucose-6-phosphate 1-epimerase
MENSIAKLCSQFDIPGTAQVVEGNGGLQKVRITSPAAEGEMYLLGGHVTSWRPAGREEMLFVSSQSRWEPGQAIRGGVPICFPWFGGKADDPKAPAHGLVRKRLWQLDSIVQSGDAVTVSMFTESDESTRRWSPSEFRLVHRATFGSELKLELVVTNTGATTMRFEEALHTYHTVGDIEKARVSGLDRIHYLDKTDSNLNKVQQGEITIVSETDRVYLDAGDEINLFDPVLHRHTRVTKQNSHTTVLWNPWIQKAHELADFADDEWKRMICIETSNVAGFAVELAPREQHTMNAVITVSDL